MYDLQTVERFYAGYGVKISAARESARTSLSLTEKKSFMHHLYHGVQPDGYRRGEEYVDFAPDPRGDAGCNGPDGASAIMNAGRKPTQPYPQLSTVDHLIVAGQGASTDLERALADNRGSVRRLLRSVSRKYGIGFWKPARE